MKTDGATRVATLHDIKHGAVFREVSSEGNTPVFGDSVVTRVDGNTVTLSRVHGFYYAETGGFYTTVETVKVDSDRLCGETSLFRVVLHASGKVYAV